VVVREAARARMSTCIMEGGSRDCGGAGGSSGSNECVSRSWSGVVGHEGKCEGEDVREGMCQSMSV
jgi:hypothetical protein